MIEIKNLTKKFDQFIAVNDLSFSVGEGEVLGFLGPNGAGKSTTMKVITGFLSPSSGSILIDNNDVSTKPIDAKALIGYLPEGAPCYGDMTPLEFLKFIAEIRGFQGQDCIDRVQHVIKEVELQKVCMQSIETLSKGFKRRVGLAQAILHDPKVLILDEPTDGLDPNQKHHVRELIKSLAKDKIVIISTHILEEVSAVCTRAIIIDAGRIVADGTPEELESQSQYHNAVNVELSAEYDLTKDLSSLKNISLQEDSQNNFTITSRNRQPIFAEISEIAQKNQWPISEFYVKKGQLEDVFRSVTQKTREGVE